VDFCADLGGPKRRPEDYPALSYSPCWQGGCVADRLHAKRRVAAAWRSTDFARCRDFRARLAVPRLREFGLLPAAIGSRSVACQRAAALREHRFPGDAITRWLDAEGYAAANTESGHWTRSDVPKPLREARSVQPLVLPDEPRGAPTALL
jgi:hypothetical protein